MPEISVIIPVFNKYKYIENSLRSVLEQPFRDLEVIAVNDGSTDESLAVLNQMAEADLFRVYHGRPQYESHKRN